MSWSSARLQPGSEVGFTESVRLGFRQYATFTGRASRSEYWYWQLFWNGSFVLLALLNHAASDPDDTDGGPVVWLAALFIVTTALPGWALAVRRLHDTGRSGWNLLWGAIPFVGSFIVFCFVIQASRPAGARYGGSPVASTESAEIASAELHASPRTALMALHAGVTAHRTVPILDDGLWQRTFAPARIVWAWGNKAQPEKFLIEVTATVSGTNTIRCRQVLRGNPVTYAGLTTAERVRRQIDGVLDDLGRASKSLSQDVPLADPPAPMVSAASATSGVASTAPVGDVFELSSEPVSDFSTADAPSAEPAGEPERPAGTEAEDAPGTAPGAAVEPTEATDNGGPVDGQHGHDDSAHDLIDHQDAPLPPTALAADPKSSARSPRRVLVGTLVVALVALTLTSLGLYSWGYRSGASNTTSAVGAAPAPDATEGSDPEAPTPVAADQPSAEAPDATPAPDPTSVPMAGPEALAVGLEFDSGQEGFGLARPATIDGGTPSERVTHITWSSYGGKVARGHGRARWTGDGPGATPQDGPVENVVVRAYDRGSCLGARAYLQLWWYFPGRGETQHNLRHGFPNVCALATAHASSAQVEIKDGKHYAFVSQIARDEVVVDLIGWVTGSEAEHQCRDDSVPEAPEEWCHDYYYRNANSRLRRFPLSPSVKVTFLRRSAEPQTTTPTELSSAIRSGELGPDPVFRFDTKGDVVTGLTQVYLP